MLALFLPPSMMPSCHRSQIWRGLAQALAGAEIAVATYTAAPIIIGVQGPNLFVLTDMWVFATTEAAAKHLRRGWPPVALVMAVLLLSAQ